jgi:protein-S-isoprenylcysteine O-methyltransferase Ste14
MNIIGRILPGLLVTAQFAIAAILVLGTDWKALSWPTATLSAVGASIAVWAWVTMGLMKLRVMPQLRENAVLLTTGPYRWVRHPMYSGLLVVIAGLISADARPERIGLGIALLIVLLANSQLEEQHLQAKFPKFSHYQQTTGRFIPRLIPQRFSAAPADPTDRLQ